MLLKKIKEAESINYCQINKLYENYSAFFITRLPCYSSLAPALKFVHKLPLRIPSLHPSLPFISVMITSSRPHRSLEAAEDHTAAAFSAAYLFKIITSIIEA